MARFCVILTLLALAAFVSPPWAAYAGIGLGGGIAVRWFVRGLIRSKRLRWAFGAFVVAAFFATFLWFSRPEPLYSVMPTRRVETSYAALVSWKPGPRPQWEVREEMALSPETWPGVQRFEIPRAVQGEIARIVQEKLGREGWRPIGSLGRMDQFQRVTAFEFAGRWFPATTTAAIPIALGGFGLLGSYIHLLPDSNSTVRIRSPKFVVASTFPAYSHRADLLQGGQEEITIPLERPRVEQHELRIAVLSPLLRWRFGPQIGALSLWQGVEWLFLAICFVFSEQIKSKVLKPLFSPLFARLNRRAEDPHEEPPQAESEDGAQQGLAADNEQLVPTDPW